MLSKIENKNVLIRFREFFNDLPDWERKELWDVLVALRGDDEEKNHLLKTFTTARIRGELLRVTHKEILPYGAYIYQTLKRAEGSRSKPTLTELKQMFRRASSHWQSHTVKAIQIILKYSPSRARDLKKFVRWIIW